MNKTITIYELLGLIKEEQAPKKIEFCGETFVFKNGRYKEISNIDGDGSTLGHYFCLDGMLNDTVEIIDNNKIEKISMEIDKFNDSYYDTALIKLAKKIDELIDEINKMKGISDDE